MASPSMSSKVSVTRNRVLVTGATGALGKTMVSKFLKEGYEVIGTYSSSSAPSFDLESNTAVGALKWEKVDLRSSSSVKSLACNIGDIGALIHCAGGFRFAKAENYEDGDIDFLLETNLKSAFFLAREFIPRMKQQNYGRMLFISSKATLQPSAGFGVYAASKAGLNALTSSLASEVLEHDITVNALLPTIIDTAANRQAMPNSDFSTWVLPEQIADIAFSLVSPLGKPINGALIPVSGRL